MLTFNSNNKKNRKLKKISLGTPQSKLNLHGKILYNNKFVYNFSSNDYLGLSNNPKLIKESILWTEKFGTSLSSSRLVSGNLDLIEKIENKIKSFYQAENCLIFSSGYQLNISVIPSILGNCSRKSDECIIFSDKLNHASINIGCKISGFKTIRYNHLDMNHLEHFLLKLKNIKNKLIISESVFSMDGDVGDIESLRNLAEKFNCYLYIDEAHSTGVLGKSGFGITELESKKNKKEISIGTFSKAFGSYGSYVCCSTKIAKNLINYCSGFIYTTALPPNVLGSISKAVEIMSQLSCKRKELLENSNFLRKKLNQLGYNTLDSKTNIIPMIKTKKTDYKKISHFLLKKGFFTSAIMTPTVPDGKERIRLTITSHINRKIILKFLEALHSFEK